MELSAMQIVVKGDYAAFEPLGGSLECAACYGAVTEKVAVVVTRSRHYLIHDTARCKSRLASSFDLNYASPRLTDGLEEAK